MNRPKLFVHIPKTAGTSFRLSAIEQFGRGRVLSDYGLGSAETSPAIRRLVLETGDPCGVIAALRETDALMLSGHLNATRYGGIFGSLNTVAFVRNPFDRVISHYRHAVRDQNFEGGLMDFARQNKCINVQSRILEGLDAALLGVIGLTEEYRVSIDVINARWDWKLQYRQANVSDRLSSVQARFSDVERKEIEKLNARDYGLYKRAQRLFANSLECLRKDNLHEPRGAINSATVANGVNGWAFYLDSDEMAELDLLINGDVVERPRCAGFRLAIAGWKVPRNGYVGFAFRELQLSRGDKVEIRDRKSGLLLDSAAVH